MKACVELRQLALPTSLGSYAPGDTRPRAHLLDLTLTIDPSLVVIDTDGMDRVFDYDPLIVEIERLARDGHYHTQERLLTRIVQACTAFPEIAGIEIALSKTPVANESGSLGLRLSVEGEDLRLLRLRLA